MRKTKQLPTGKGELDEGVSHLERKHALLFSRSFMREIVFFRMYGYGSGGTFCCFRCPEF